LKPQLFQLQLGLLTLSEQSIFPLPTDFISLSAIVISMSDQSLDNKEPATMHVETSSAPSAQASLATHQAAYEKSLTFWATLRIFWRATLWIMYGQLVVFGYGIDGVIAGYLLAIPRFR
jgi:hypothetical protein